MEEVLREDNETVLMEIIGNDIKEEYFVLAAKYGAFNCIKAMYDKVRDNMSKKQWTPYEEYSQEYAEFLKEQSASRMGQANKRMATAKTCKFEKPRISIVPEEAYGAAFNYALENGDNLSTVKMLMALGIPCSESIRTTLKSNPRTSGYDAIMHRFLFINHALPTTLMMKNVTKRKDLLKKEKRKN